MDNKQELRLRRKAIRLYVKGIRSKVILKKVQRSRAWFSKWQKRFDQQGATGLRSRSRRPHHISITCSPRIERLIVRTRQRLTNQKVGLIGPRCQCSGHRRQFYLEKGSGHREHFLTMADKPNLIHAFSQKEAAWTTNRSFDCAARQYASI